MIPLTAFTREIEITDVNQNLREIRVTIRYPYGSAYRDYVLFTYMAAFA